MLSPVLLCILHGARCCTSVHLSDAPCPLFRLLTVPGTGCMTPVLHSCIPAPFKAPGPINPCLFICKGRKAHFTALALIYLSHCSFIHSSFIEHLLYWYCALCYRFKRKYHWWLVLTGSPVQSRVKREEMDTLLSCRRISLKMLRH